ncbi:MBL fold metallo-hydrolase [Gordonia sputi]|uniref:MBL fold metallo-hydrolase n=1 Tax=Gordonia sputi TaxID=36823 RepID=UPI002271C1C7|nr:MBL fold metallo-hydrolase [Gordonia sputi]
MSVEVAALALALYREHRGDRQVTALIYTHSHLDHYGGAKGILSDDDMARGDVRVIAPEGFLYEAVAENVFAGNAMARRAVLMYGAVLSAGPLGMVDAGLGKTNSIGQLSLIAPTEYVSQTGETLTVDGIDIEFTMAPHTEASRLGKPRTAAAPASIFFSMTVILPEKPGKKRHQNASGALYLQWTARPESILAAKSRTP